MINYPHDPQMSFQISYQATRISNEHMGEPQISYPWRGCRYKSKTFMHDMFDPIINIIIGMSIVFIKIGIHSSNVAMESYRYLF